jgi:hypothetical protein
MRIPFISLIAAGSLALGGCAYGGLGFDMGYGNGYYGSYGNGYYGSYGRPYYGGYGYGYDDPWYGGYGSYAGYGSPYFGWYDNYYYPGTGYYVYDTYRRPHMWTSRQRSYWTSRQRAATGTTVTSPKTNWSGFTTRSATLNTSRSTARENWQERRRNRVRD